jgi:hypothetical protein
MSQQRAERLTYIAQELHIIRHDLARLAGSDRVAEVRMVDDLACAIDGLIREANQPRSRPYVPSVYGAQEARS